MKIKPSVVVGAFLFFLSPPESGRCAGVTIITHGFNGNVTDWIIPMAQQMVRYNLFPGTNFSCYEMSVAGDYSVTQSRIGGTSPLVSDSGEILVKLDWSELSTDAFNSTTDVADSAVPNLLSSTFIPELGGRPLAQFPIHLIGHSRGGSVVAEMARLLGAEGVWVDHLTTLDPHPVSFPYGDAEVDIFVNVLFADNYWQTNPDAFCPNGEAIFGTYDRYLANLQNGYSCDHSDVHLWYHGTIDWQDTPASDTQAEITSTERQTWWTPYEAQGNSANRFALPSNNGSWPNIIKFNLLGSQTVTQSDLVPMQYYFQFGQSPSQSATVRIYLDTDANPYNGNSGQIFQITESGTGTGMVVSRPLSFNTSGTLPGTYWLYAEISDGTHTRLLHAAERLSVKPASCAYLPCLKAERVGNNLILSWTTNFTGFALESTGLLPAADWQPVGLMPAIMGNRNTVTNDLSGEQKWFRLRKP